MNQGDGDLDPNFRKSIDAFGGYALEVDVPSAIFREAQPGDFAKTVAYAEGKPVAIPFATRLQFKFAQLRAKEKLQTGLIQLAPGADLRQARYRILNNEESSPWKSLE
jgi:hypothetical protein